MSYLIEIKAEDIDREEDRVLLDVVITSPDGHRCGHSLNLRMGDAHYFQLGLESEEEARQRGHIMGLLDAIEDRGAGDL